MYLSFGSLMKSGLSILDLIVKKSLEMGGAKCKIKMYLTSEKNEYEIDDLDFM
jgi:hypothetical protein